MIKIEKNIPIPPLTKGQEAAYKAWKTIRRKKAAHKAWETIRRNKLAAAEQNKHYKIAIGNATVFVAKKLLCDVIPSEKNTLYINYKGK